MLKTLDRLSKTTKLVSLFVIMSLLSGTLSGCGSSSTDPPQVQSQKTMEMAFSDLHKAGGANISAEDKTTALNSALANATQAYDLFPNQESLLVKGFIETGLKKITEAEATLAKVKAEYPGHSEAEFLMAYLSAQENRDTETIYTYLNASRDDNFSEMDEDLWYGMLEKLGAFENFRTTTQYQNLLALKTTSKEISASSNYVCKEDRTRYKTHWYGMEIDLSHKLTKDVELGAISGVSFGTSLLFLDIVLMGIVEVWLTAEWIALMAVDAKYGCGVKLHDSWLSIPIFMPTAQK
jgi:hypothetical protein